MRIMRHSLARLHVAAEETRPLERALGYECGTIEDDEVTLASPHDPAFDEILHDTAHHLARSADPRGDLGRAHADDPFAAGLVRLFQNHAHDAPIHVPQAELREAAVRRGEPAYDRRQHGRCGGSVLQHVLQQRLARNESELARLFGFDAGRVDGAGDNARLAEELARAKSADRELAAIAAVEQDADPARDDHVKAGGRLTGPDDERTAPAGAFLNRGGERRDRRRFPASETEASVSIVPRWGSTLRRALHSAAD